MQGKRQKSSQNKTHFAYRFLVVRDTTVWRFVEQEVQRGAWRQISGTTNQIVPYGLKICTSQSDRSIRTQSHISQSDRSVRTTFRTSQSDRSIRTTKPYKPIRSLHFARTVTGQNFRKDPVTRMITDRTSDEAISPSLKPPSHRTISDRTKKNGS